MSTRLLLLVLFSGSTVADFSDYEDTIQGKQKADTRSKASSKGSVRDNNVAVIAKRQRTPTRLLQRNVPHSQMQISADEMADLVAFRTVHPHESLISAPRGLSPAHVDTTKGIAPHYDIPPRTPPGTMNSHITPPTWNSNWPVNREFHASYQSIAPVFEMNENANERTRKFSQNPYAYSGHYYSSYYYYGGYYDGYRYYLILYPQYYYD
uniref:Uncharacterized protein n=1 Tax=Parascaris univalens TaxID=6257 RepID=A0A915CFW2_PARUN